MPSSLATVLTIGFTLFMFIWDRRRNGPSSPALWLPAIWLVIAASRFLSQWLQLGHPSLDLSSVSEGSPLDAIFFLLLITVGGGVLVRRRVVLTQIVKNNIWLFAFFAFGFISILWSDFPFIAFKRWIKTVGHPVMALIILTDPQPQRAVKTVLKRCAYFLLPFSVLFIKYLPQYGRGFDSFTGAATNNGVGGSKNDLGYFSMISGLFFLWNILQVRSIADKVLRRWELLISVGFLWMALWLLYMSHSATSLTAMIVGAAILLLLETSLINKRYVATYLVVTALVAFVLQISFDVYDGVIEMLGRNPNLTDRTYVWTDVIAMQQHPLIGAGFESFWLGSRLNALWAKYWWHPIQAHNGYIETYLNLGLIGVVLLGGMLIATFRKVTADLTDQFSFSRLRLAFLLAIIMFNYTEAGFKAVHFMWTIFYLVALEYQSKPQTLPTKLRRGIATMAPRSLRRVPEQQES